MSQTKKDQRLQLQIDIEMLAWLREEAEERRCSIAQIVRDMILRERKEKLARKEA